MISLTVEIQFVSQIHLELGEWIRGANPTFTELLNYHFRLSYNRVAIADKISENGIPPQIQ